MKHTSMKQLNHHHIANVLVRSNLFCCKTCCDQITQFFVALPYRSLTGHWTKIDWFTSAACFKTIRFVTTQAIVSEIRKQFIWYRFYHCNLHNPQIWLLQTHNTIIVHPSACVFDDTYNKNQLVIINAFKTSNQLTQTYHF